MEWHAIVTGSNDISQTLRLLILQLLIFFRVSDINEYNKIIIELI